MKSTTILSALLLGAISSLSAQALTKTTTTLSSSQNPSAYGQGVTFTAVVSPAPTDSGEVISFTQGKTVLGTEALNSGSANLTISTLKAGGTDSITAAYAGDSTYAASTSKAVSQVVDAASTTTSLTSSLNPSNVGQAVTFTATVTPEYSDVTLTGTVGFYNGTKKLVNETVSGNVASYTSSALTVGTDSMTAVFNTNNSFSTSTSGAVSQVVGAGTTPTKTTTTLSSSQNPSSYGQGVTFTAVVAPAPTNSGEVIAFMQGKTVLGTGPLTSGSASFTISTLMTGGTDSITAAYAGDSSYAASTSSAVAQVVDPASTTTSLSSSQNPSNVGQTVTFTSTVTPEYSGSTVTGTVGFYNGTKKLGNATLSGNVASYVATTLTTAATDSITAVYNGSNSFSTSTSGAVSQVVGTGTTINSTMTWDGITRYYETFVPTALPANPPLLVMLHGTRFTSSASDWDAVVSVNWGWAPFADQYGFILVQPASTYDPATTQWNWDAYFMSSAFPPSAIGTCTTPPATACPDDAGFLRQLIVNLSAQYSVNPDMVYVVGFSSGAQMAERVGVEVSDLVAAIVPASGQMEGQTTAPPPVLAPGNAVAPVSVQEWQGTEDENLWPCGYGTTVYSGVTFTLDTVDDTFNYWVNQNSCTMLQTTATLCTSTTSTAPNNANDAPTPGSSTFTGNIATGCVSPNGQSVEVQFVWEPGIAHSYQATNNAARWAFLAAHPKQSATNKK